MRVGLLSDTHDRVSAIDALLKEMLAREVSFVLHAGDFCSPFSLRPFQDHGVAMAGVFGRNDMRKTMRAGSPTPSSMKHSTARSNSCRAC